MECDKSGIKFISFYSWISDLIKLMLRILAIFLMLSPFAGYVSWGQNLSRYVSGVVVVQFAPEVNYKTGLHTGLQEFDHKTARYEVYSIERAYPFLDHVAPTPKTRQNLLALRRTYYVRYHSDAVPEQVAVGLESTQGVVYAEPLEINRAHPLQFNAVPNDQFYNEQKHLQQLRLPQAWDIVKAENGSPRVVVAVVGSGGEWQHEDLQANVWTNSDEVAGNGIDDDANGFIDDVYGVNFARDDSNDPAEGVSPNDHSGTAAAGIMGAVTDNGVGMAGAAWNPYVMHINAGCAQGQGDGATICSGYDGIIYAATNGADIIHIGWSNVGTADSETSRLVNQILNLATDSGALIVASAASRGSSPDQDVRYPARHPRVLAVGATEELSRRLTDFSNYGQLVSIYAPGVKILATARENGYGYVRGSTAPTSLVAGVAALVKTKFPDISPDELHERIRNTSENMDAENPNYEGELGGGFVNALAAVESSRLTFSGGIGNQSYPRTQPITPLTLPEAVGGAAPITYTLTPSLPAGLSFDPSARTLSGTPTELIPPTPFIYAATDADNVRGTLRFTIEVHSPVSTEQDVLPTEFTVYASYPNPFRHVTSIRMDLPWSARVEIEVLDVTGRRMLVQPPADLPAGSGQEIVLQGMELPSGAYLYRLTADSVEGRSVHVGHFVRIR